ncbi:MAG: Asp23/Gls24 family envelope stress response protein [Victivallales bacterium]|nr:Asp23/Gls24 family envelope stress response protein [Victivallales bacterium]
MFFGVGVAAGMRRPGKNKEWEDLIMREKSSLRLKQPETKTEAPAYNNANEKSTELGLIRIHENVISSLVRKATCQVEGVTRLAGSSFVDNIGEIVGSRKISDRAISIDMGDNAVEIEVKINIAFGNSIPDVADRVQHAVVELVERTTGMTVTHVNVLIQEIEDETTAEEAGEEETEEVRRENFVEG